MTVAVSEANAGRRPRRLPLALSLALREQRNGFKGFYVAAFPVDHTAGAVGYAIVEHERPGRFDEETARELGVEFGPEFGKLQRGEAVTTPGGVTVTPEQVVGEPRMGLKIIYSGDTAPCESLRIAAHQADVLVHESSFGDEEAERAAETRHSTARQAAQIALEAEVQMLCLTHVSGRYFGKELRAEAREVFANTELPRDFDIVEVPFPERGKPQLVRDE